MGIFKIGAECCNNCIHWDARRDDKHGSDVVYATSNCSKCTSSHGPRKGMNTLSKNVCPYFRHIWGVQRTFPLEEAPSSGIGGVIDSFDEPSRAIMQATMDYIQTRDSINRAARIVDDDDDDELTALEQSILEDVRREREREQRRKQEEKERREREARERERARLEGLYEKGLSRWSSQSEADQFEDLLDKANWWNAEGRFDLGVCYLNGLGVDKNPEEASKWFKSAAELQESDEDKVAWYRKSAELGDAYSEFKVGYAYYFGKGVEEDEAEAFKWFKRAAEADDPYGMCRLGECYFNGRGVEINHAAGVEWYKKAAEKGEALAQVSIGLMFYKGNDTVEKNLCEAFKWFALAAAKRADAKAYLGECYENGYGVAEDKERAGGLYKESAEADNPNGCYNYARCLEDGLCGVERSLSGALSYYKKAAEKGVAEACFRIGQFYNNGWSVDKDINAAFEWYLKAAEKGVPEAQDWVGAFYRDGRGDVEKDCAKQ